MISRCWQHACSVWGLKRPLKYWQKQKLWKTQGKHIVHLEIGEPDFDTPRNIDAAIKTLNEGYTHYSPA